jgi:hypothetical protein
VKAASAGGKLTGTGVAPSLQITPSPLAFPSTTLGLTSAAQTYTVKNTGIGPNKLGAITFTGTNPGDFAVSGGTCGNGVTLAAGATCTVAAQFKPLLSGGRTATLSVASQTPTTVTATAIANGTGITPPPAPVFTLTLTPSPTDFGTSNIGTQVARVMVVTNTGNVVNIVGAMTFGGADTGDFAVVANSCTGVALGVNATCDVTVGFNPLAVGTRTATLTANGQNGSASTANLTGGGQSPPPVLLPQLSITPSQATFPQEIVGTPAPPISFTVKNTGQAPDTLVGTSVAGLSFAEYTVVSNGCTPGLVLQVNATCTLSVGFTPADAGQRVATLVVNGSAGTSATAQLQGTGIFGPSLTFNPGVTTPGRNIDLSGAGFPRLSPVALVVTFGDQTENLTVQTDANGVFTTGLFVLRNTALGTRTVTAPAVVGVYPDTKVTLLVVADTFKPQRVTNPAFFGDTGLLSRG